MVLNLNLSKEKFSDAYLRAVVSAARMHVEPREVDTDSVDGYIQYTGPLGGDFSPLIGYQLKCTATPTRFRNDHLPFRLSVKNYEDLRVFSAVRRILIVVIVPEAVADWVLHDESELRVRRCGYWMSLRGAPPTRNLRWQTVQVPRQNRFTVSDLDQMMLRVANGGEP